jgi:hypothetical protein
MIALIETASRLRGSVSAIRIGVDLGNAGGVAELTASGELIAVHAMPVLADRTKGRPTLNAPLLAELIARTHATVAYVEWVAARPTDGSIQALVSEERVVPAKESARVLASASGF